MSRELGRDDAKVVHPSKTQHKFINEGEFGGQNAEGSSIAYPSETRPQENIPELPLLSNDADNVSILLESEKELEQEIAAFESPDMDGQHIANPYETNLEPLNKEVIAEIEVVPIVDRKEVRPVFMEGEVSSVADTSLSELGLVFEEDIMEVSIDDVPLTEIGPVIEEIMEGDNVPLDDTSQIELRHVIDEVIMKGGDVPADDMSQTELGSVIEEDIMVRGNVSVDNMSQRELTQLIDDFNMEEEDVSVDDTSQTRLELMIKVVITEEDNIKVADTSEIELRSVIKDIIVEVVGAANDDTSQMELEPMVEEIIMEGNYVPIDVPSQTYLGSVIEEVIMEGGGVPVVDTFQTELEVMINVVLLEGEGVPVGDTSQTELTTVIEDVIMEAVDVTVVDTSQTELGPVTEEIVMEVENVLHADLYQTEFGPFIKEVTMEGNFVPVIDTSQMELEPVIEEVAVEGKGVPVVDTFQTELEVMINVVLLEGEGVPVADTSQTELTTVIEDVIMEAVDVTVIDTSQTELGPVIEEIVMEVENVLHADLSQTEFGPFIEEITMEGNFVPVIDTSQMELEPAIEEVAVEGKGVPVDDTDIGSVIEEVIMEGVGVSVSPTFRNELGLEIEETVVAGEGDVIPYRSETELVLDLKDTCFSTLPPFKLRREKNSEELSLFLKDVENTSISPLSKRQRRNLNKKLKLSKKYVENLDECIFKRRLETRIKNLFFSGGRGDETSVHTSDEDDVRDWPKFPAKKCAVFTLHSPGSNTTRLKFEEQSLFSKDAQDSSTLRVSNSPLKKGRKKNVQSASHSRPELKSKEPILFYNCMEDVDVPITRLPDRNLEQTLQGNKLLNIEAEDVKIAGRGERGPERKIQHPPLPMESENDVSSSRPTRKQHRKEIRMLKLIKKNADVSMVRTHKPKIQESEMLYSDVKNVSNTHSFKKKVGNRSKKSLQKNKLKYISVVHSPEKELEEQTEESTFPSQKVKEYTKASLCETDNEHEIEDITDIMEDDSMDCPSEKKLQHKTEKPMLFNANVEHAGRQASVRQPRIMCGFAKGRSRRNRQQWSTDISISPSSKSRKEMEKAVMSYENAENIPIIQPSESELEQKVEEPILFEENEDKLTLFVENIENVPVTKLSNTELEEKMEQSSLLDKSEDISVAHSLKAKLEKRNGKPTLANENADNVPVTQPSNTELEDKIEQSTLLDKNVDISVAHSSKAKLGKRNGKSTLPNENADNDPVTHRYKTELDQKAEEPTLLDKNVDISAAGPSKAKRGSRKGKSILCNKNADNVPIMQRSKSEFEQKGEKPTFLYKNVVAGPSKDKVGKENRKSATHNVNIGSMEKDELQICGAKTRYRKYKMVGHVCRSEATKSYSFVELARRSTVPERLLAIGFLISSVGFLFKIKYLGWLAACINCTAVSTFTRRDYWRLAIYYALATCCLVIFKHLFEFLN